MADRGTVFVTGATGFIAKHVVLRLLEEGYNVRGSVRAADRGREVVDAVRPYLSDDSDLDRRLIFETLDLRRDEGWSGALDGCDALFHTASPFPLEQPDDEEELIRPAVDGTQRALRAARDAGIARVVLTSSSVAVVNTDLEPGRDTYDERDWSDLTGPLATPYVKSKTRAERAAWDFVRDEAPQIALTVINPTFVLGPPLDDHSGTSLKVIQRILRARDPMVPRVGFFVADVRDIALMHVRALDRPESIGKRFIGGEDFFWYADISQVVKDAFPDRKVVTRTAPDLVIRFLSLFDRPIRTILPNLGRRDKISCAQARDVLGIDFIDPRDSVRATADFILKNNLI